MSFCSELCACLWVASLSAPGRITTRLAVAGEHQHIVPLAHGPSRLLIERCEIDSCRHCQLAELPRSDPLPGLAKDRRLGLLEA